MQGVVAEVALLKGPGRLLQLLGAHQAAGGGGGSVRQQAPEWQTPQLPRIPWAPLECKWQDVWESQSLSFGGGPPGLTADLGQTRMYRQPPAGQAAQDCLRQCLQLLRSWGAVGRLSGGGHPGGKGGSAGPAAAAAGSSLLEAKKERLELA